MVAAAETTPITYEFYKIVPTRTRAENLDFRAKLVDAANENPHMAALIWWMCERDPLFFINAFCWTYDPRGKPFKKIPMVTYRFQNRAICLLVRGIDQGSDRLLEKSRDMGASWICILVFLWFWMFRPFCSFLLGSRNQDYVDKTGNPKCLFWKLDFALRHLPDFLRPRFDRIKNNLTNLDTYSVIDGEATNPDFASGDRRTAILLDEFAKVPHAHESWTSTRDVTNCRIVNSTHKGTGTTYYTITQTGIKQIRMHWSDHPIKAIGLYTKQDGAYVFLDEEYWSRVENPQEEAKKLDERILARGVALEDGKKRSPWYALQCERAAHAFEIAQELDIDVLGSETQFFNQTAIESYIARFARRAMLVGDFEFDPDTCEPIGFTENPRGKVRLWIPLDGYGKPTMKTDISMGADISAGTGATNSVLSGISGITHEKVFEFASPWIRPEEFGRFAVAICKWFGGAFLIWEQQGPGRQFGDSVVETGYRHFFTREDEEKLVKKKTMIPGWVPTRPNKRALLGEYGRALYLETLMNYSEPALLETLQYVFVNNTVEHSAASTCIDPSGARENHGDRVIADALAWKGAKPAPLRRDGMKKTEAKVPISGTFGARQKAARCRRGRKTCWN